MVFNVRDNQLQIKTTYPHQIKQIRHVWIPMRDGVKLSARIWLPEDAENEPVPAILEYIPYRKDDFTALRDSIRHPYFAGHGYASVRVDTRGSGDSEGILYDEYLPQEQDDAEDVLKWIANQSWSTGKTGMIGKSWGGFNGLQVAARKPPELKAVITICSTDDRYADDVHYKGGALLASDMLWWASTMFAYNARPADPEIVGEKWRENWMQRMEETPPFAEEWVRHQRRDAYWKHGSVNEDYQDIEVPVFAVGGWADGYTNAIPRMMEGLDVPRKGLIGPWAHEYPEVAIPGPSIGFLQECLRWWDYWLKDKETGIMDEPMLRAWMQESLPPEVEYEERPGRWVAEAQWPSANIIQKGLYVAGQELVEAAEDGSPITVSSMQQHGLYAGVFCPFGQPGDMPSDQRLENGFSTIFTSAPLEEKVEILGAPKLQLELASDQKQALLAVRLNDVAPDGSVSRITWGMLNLTHRNSHEFPEALTPEEKIVVTVQMNDIGYALPAGHRWQVAIAPTYWPHAWPSPKEATLTVYPGHHSKLLLPTREAQAIDKTLSVFGAPETAPVLEKEVLRPESRKRQINYDLVSKTWILDDYSDEGARKLADNGLEYGSTNRNVYTVKEGDPLSANVQCDWTMDIGRGEWQTHLNLTCKMWCDEAYFYLQHELHAFEGDKEVFTKKWGEKILRDFI
ncbi:CocE/NonD family hydrolase [Terribacillus sp. DMT04]|uniref:CocE/NonD family hydrolase n=1 Tax=Terribacillus sp. DMT04 TaxID=2850441 RepID=UPI001C2BF9CC|nr:CocE/NonD family hydrolase [Terribacillus sp. DMT04]QXE01633.1 CocE/NonD family hydrolase [Terribacillus sp. DMT04]